MPPRRPLVDDAAAPRRVLLLRLRHRVYPHHGRESEDSMIRRRLSRNRGPLEPWCLAARPARNFADLRRYAVLGISGRGAQAFNDAAASRRRGVSFPTRPGSRRHHGLHRNAFRPRPGRWRRIARVLAVCIADRRAVPAGAAPAPTPARRALIPPAGPCVRRHGPDIPRVPRGQHGRVSARGVGPQPGGAGCALLSGPQRTAESAQYR